MSNRKLRVELAALLKAHGLGKLYYGPKIRAFRGLKADTLRRGIFCLGFKPGDIIHDCDGFNHVIKSWKIDRWVDIDGERIIIDQAEFEDCSFSCGCPYGPYKPATRQEIEQYHEEFFEDSHVEELKAGGWWGPSSQALYDAVKAGQPICDDNGIRLPQFKRHCLGG